MHKYEICTKGNLIKVPLNNYQKSDKDNEIDLDIDEIMYLFIATHLLLFILNHGLSGLLYILLLLLNIFAL